MEWKKLNIGFWIGLGLSLALFVVGRVLTALGSEFWSDFGIGFLVPLTGLVFLLTFKLNFWFFSALSVLYCAGAGYFIQRIAERFKQTWSKVIVMIALVILFLLLNIGFGLVSFAFGS